MNETMDILVVEDDPNDLELTVRSLRKAELPLTVHIARDGPEALDYLFCQGSFATPGAAPRPKLVLLDLKLPKLDGIEVLQALRADPRTRELPIVVMTSSRQQRDIDVCYRLGVNSYVVKPVDAQTFTESVQQVGAYWLRVNHAPQAAPGQPRSKKPPARDTPQGPAASGAEPS